MTLEEAINVLTPLAQSEAELWSEGDSPALFLGIEALKRCKVLAENSPLWAAKPLPGETKEPT